MENVTMTKEGNILTIKVDLSKSGTPSASGKTMVIASTKGNIKVPGTEETFIGVNVYRKR